MNFPPVPFQVGGRHTLILVAVRGVVGKREG